MKTSRPWEDSVGRFTLPSRQPTMLRIWQRWRTRWARWTESGFLRECCDPIHHPISGIRLKDKLKLWTLGDTVDETFLPLRKMPRSEWKIISLCLHPRYAGNNDSSRRTRTGINTIQGCFPNRDMSVRKRSSGHEAVKGKSKTRMPSSRPSRASL